jgi:4-diphosphocytidyl-2-C-methyl-D-erythritol kinase
MTLYRCYAKVNLTLEVLRRRDDGYHDLASVVHTISLADDLNVEADEALLSRVEGLEPILEDNLVDRAARLLASSTNTRAGARLTLLKRIPAAAGLGGGSSDAAATLVALNALWGTRLGYHALVRLALQVGSDVPFFLRGGAAVMSGRGEQLRALPPLPDQWLVLTVPSVTLPNKTGRLFSALEPSDFGSGAASEAAAARLERGEGLLADALINSFDRAARAVFPGLEAAWRMVEQCCGRRFCLSGAGPALYALATDRAEARQLAALLSNNGIVSHAARTVKHARATARRASATLEGFSPGRPIEYA